MQPHERYYLFNISGIGGVGKSALLDQFRKIAEEEGFITASTDKDEKTPQAVMWCLAEQIGKKYLLREFTKRYKVYCKKSQNLTRNQDPSQVLAKAGGILVGQGVHSLMPSLPAEPFTTIGEVAFSSFQNIWDKDEFLLEQDPQRELTVSFLKDLCSIAQREVKFALFFDGYEHNSDFLDSWFLDVLKERYGSLPAQLVFIIAGRQELDRTKWRDHQRRTNSIVLKPFDEEEATNYLNLQGITNSRSIEKALRDSGGLPLHLSLVKEDPNAPGQIYDQDSAKINHGVVMNFISDITDSECRNLVKDAALPLYINRDIITLLYKGDDVHKLFDWLKSIHFIEERKSGWEYHEAARNEIVQFNKRESPEDWNKLHRKLENYYEKSQSDLQLTNESKWKDPDWNGFEYKRLYHRICQLPSSQKRLEFSLSSFLPALKIYFWSAVNITYIISRAGKDLDDSRLESMSKDLRRGLEAYREKDYEVTIEVFSALLNSSFNLCSDSCAAALNWRGYTYWLNEQESEALQDLNQALKLAPEEANYYVDRGQVYYWKGKDHYALALKDFEQAINLDPQCKWAFAFRGLTHQAMKNYKNAIEDFNNAINLDREYSFALIGRGQTYRAMRDYDKSIKDFDRILKYDSNDISAISQKAITNRLRGQYQEAIQDFDRVLKIASKNTWLIVQKGITLRALGRFEEAFESFNSAIQIDKGYAWAFSQQGYTHYILGNPEEAFQNFSRALELNDNKDVWTLQQRGIILGLWKRVEEALADFNQAIELDKENDLCLFCRALCYKYLNQSDKAQTDLIKAIDIAQASYGRDPGNWGNTYNLALYHLANNDLDRAESLYKEALNKNAPPHITQEAVRGLEGFLQLFSTNESSSINEKALQLKQFLEEQVKQ